MAWAYAGGDPYTGHGTELQTPAPAKKPAPKPKAAAPAAPVPQVPGPSSILPPVPTAPVSTAMQGFQSAGAGPAPLDAINGGQGGLLRQDLGTRQPPSLAALLQGLRY